MIETISYNNNYINYYYSNNKKESTPWVPWQSRVGFDFSNKFVIGGSLN